MGEITYFTFDIKTEDKVFSFDNKGINELNEKLVELIGRASKIDRETGESEEMEY